LSTIKLYLKLRHDLPGTFRGASHLKETNAACFGNRPGPAKQGKGWVVQSSLVSALQRAGVVRAWSFPGWPGGIALALRTAEEGRRTGRSRLSAPCRALGRGRTDRDGDEDEGEGRAVGYAGLLAPDTPRLITPPPSVGLVGRMIEGLFSDFFSGRCRSKTRGVRLVNLRRVPFSWICCCNQSSRSPGQQRRYRPGGHLPDRSRFTRRLRQGSSSCPLHDVEGSIGLAYS